MKTSFKTTAAALALAISTLAFGVDWAPGSTAGEPLPAVKMTRLGLYLTPPQAYDFKQKEARALP